jgi:hypothetical protein
MADRLSVAVFETELSSLYCKLQSRPLVREGAPHQQTCNCLKIIKERRGKIGRGSQMGAWHHDRLADWLSVVIQLWLWLWLWLSVWADRWRTKQILIFLRGVTIFGRRGWRNATPEYHLVLACSNIIARLSVHMPLFNITEAVKWIKQRMLTKYSY